MLLSFRSVLKEKKKKKDLNSSLNSSIQNEICLSDLVIQDPIAGNGEKTGTAGE